MKKIGIVTFFRSVNHGAVLQAFALQNTIRGFGHDCRIVSYQTEKSRKAGSVPVLANVHSPRSLCRYLIDGFLLRKPNRRRWQRVDNFIAVNMTLTRKYTNYDELATSPPDCDVFVCGSDQIWNPNITECDRSFLLDFVKEGRKRVAYAPSFGISEMPEWSVDVFKKALKEFDSISVRETEGAAMVSRLTGQAAEVVLDPTLLMTSREWEPYATRPPSKASYILCHAVGDPSRVIHLAKELKSKTGYDIIRLDGALRRNLRACFHPAVTPMLDAGPGEFLGFFQNAAYVVTTSYHGTIFSILNRKPFWSIMNASPDLKARNSRLTTLLDMLNISCRLIDGGLSLPVDSQTRVIDYDDVEKRLAQARAKSLKYLREATA